MHQSSGVALGPHFSWGQREVGWGLPSFQGRAMGRWRKEADNKLLLCVHGGGAEEELMAVSHKYPSWRIKARWHWAPDGARAPWASPGAGSVGTFCASWAAPSAAEPSLIWATDGGKLCRELNLGWQCCPARPFQAAMWLLCWVVWWEGQ